MCHYGGRMTTHELTRLLRAYAAARGISISTAGRQIGGHGHFASRCEEGSISLHTAERSIQRISDHWPSHAEWPSDVPRPAPSAGSPAALAASPAGGSSPATLLARVREELERCDAAMLADDWATVQAAELAGIEIGSTLGADGLVACPEALCAALHCQRHVYDDVVRRYADGSGRRPRGARTKRMLAVLRASGDRRFAPARAAA